MVKLSALIALSLTAMLLPELEAFSIRALQSKLVPFQKELQLKAIALSGEDVFVRLIILAPAYSKLSCVETRIPIQSDGSKDI